MRIVCIALGKACQLKAPIYTQNDVIVFDDFTYGAAFVEEEMGKPPPTLRIARGAVAWAKKLELSELWVAAARPHLWRCLRDMKAVICEAGVKINVQYCEEIYSSMPDDKWFCPDSTQARTRSRKNWERRERVLRILPFFIYRMFCS